jgi:hypothetical protein
MRALPVVLAALALAGCSKKAPPTFEAVAPILERACVSCHNPEGVSPVPSLLTYEEVRASGSKIRVAVRTRMMPPFGADNNGGCGQWRDALWLSDAEIGTLVRWVDAGMPAGSKKPRDLVVPNREPRLRVSSVVDTGGPYQPGIGETAYRCFVVDPKVAANTALTAFRVTSTERRIVPVVALYALDTEAAEAAAAKLDAESEGMGYPCYGGPRVQPSHFLASWNWDRKQFRFPTGTGLALTPGRKWVVQVLYDIIAVGMDATTHTKVELETAPLDRVRPAEIWRVGPRGFSLLPGQEYAEATSQEASAGDWVVHGIAPRMHSLGTAMQLDVVRGARDERCLATFDHWRPYRQQLFQYEAPQRITSRDSVRVRCAYKTLNAQTTVQDGDAIEDEQCSAYLYVTRWSGSHRSGRGWVTSPVPPPGRGALSPSPRADPR